MKPTSFQIRECENPNCGLRYPLVETQPSGERCPLCLGQTHKTLSGSTNTPEIHKEEASPSSIAGMLDNIRSGWNVGSMFRTAEGFGLNHLHLCGITSTPNSVSLKKTALGAEASVPWTYHSNSIKAAEKLKNDGYLLWALEYNSNAESIFSIAFNRNGLQNSKGVIIVAGNEEIGVDPDLLRLCTKTLYIPMRGEKQSFNVAVAFGIALGILSNP